MKKNKKAFIIRILSVILFALGMLFISYPTVSDAYGRVRSSRLKLKYSDAVRSMDSDIRTDMLLKAKEYNKSMTIGSALITKEQNSLDPVYEGLLDPLQNGIMAYIDIPSIGVSLPVYHYSKEKELEKGVGHIHGSSLPVGGEGSHAVLIAHRGLPQSMLFSELNRLMEGDVFYIHVLGETLCYEVREIITILPSDTGMLTLEEGKDQITLVTCTPYGVNTHRLLVRGERVEYKGEDTAPDMKETVRAVVDKRACLCFGIMIIALVLFFVRKAERTDDE